MQTNQQRARAHIMRRLYTGEKQRREPSTRTVTVYPGIDDFLRANPIAAADRYGERVISGTRIC